MTRYCARCNATVILLFPVPADGAVFCVPCIEEMTG